MKAFKAYDIRGVYGQDFNRDDVYRIGWCLPRLLQADCVLVGRDARESSDEIFAALTNGIRDNGADVVDIGLSTTPMVYFSTVRYGMDASVQITASHNPAAYNGMKISRTGALPVGGDSGLEQLAQMIREGPFAVASERGKIRTRDAKRDYLSFLQPFVPDLTDLAVGIDCSNGMTALLIHDLLGDGPLYLYDTIDGRFPNHAPNPLLPANVRDLQDLVQREELDLGVIFDGDGDRVMFVDGQARFVRPDLIIPVLARHFLAQDRGIVLHDIRTSRAVSNYIRELGGSPYMWKVGHAFAKLKMRELGAVFGGELAGHYYFRDFFNCDSGLLAGMVVLGVVAGMKKSGELLEDFVDQLSIYANSGERNYRVQDKKAAMEAVRELVTGQAEPVAFHDFDGYRIEFSDWWINVRPSNTEPYLRVIIEADTRERLSAELAAVETILGKPE